MRLEKKWMPRKILNSLNIKNANRIFLSRKKPIIGKVVFIITFVLVCVESFAKGVGFIEKTKPYGFIDELLMSDVLKDPHECEGFKGHLGMMNLTDYRHEKVYDKVTGCWRFNDNKTRIIFVSRMPDGQWHHWYFDANDLQSLDTGEYSESYSSNNVGNKKTSGEEWNEIKPLYIFVDGDSKCFYSEHGMLVSPWGNQEQPDESRIISSDKKSMVLIGKFKDKSITKIHHYLNLSECESSLKKEMSR